MQGYLLICILLGFYILYKFAELYIKITLILELVKEISRQLDRSNDLLSSKIPSLLDQQQQFIKFIGNSDYKINTLKMQAHKWSLENVHMEEHVEATKIIKVEITKLESIQKIQKDGLDYIQHIILQNKIDGICARGLADYNCEHPVEKSCTNLVKISNDTRKLLDVDNRSLTTKDIEDAFELALKAFLKNN